MQSADGQVAAQQTVEGTGMLPVLLSQSVICVLQALVDQLVHRVSSLPSLVGTKLKKASPGHARSAHKELEKCRNLP